VEEEEEWRRRRSRGSVLGLNDKDRRHVWEEEEKERVPTLPSIVRITIIPSNDGLPITVLSITLLFGIHTAFFFAYIGRVAERERD
jgi:hypothetical protein